MRKKIDRGMSIDRLHELFCVCTVTGVLTRKISRRAHKIGTVGWAGKGGYLFTKINRRVYAVSRIVFAMTNDYWPVEQVDHINRDRVDNRPCNLRDVPCAVNSQNRDNRTCGLRSWESRRLNRNPLP